MKKHLDIDFSQVAGGGQNGFAPLHSAWVEQNAERIEAGDFLRTLAYLFNCALPPDEK